MRWKLIHLNCPLSLLHHSAMGKGQSHAKISEAVTVWNSLPHTLPLAFRVAWAKKSALGLPALSHQEMLHLCRFFGVQAATRKEVRGLCCPGSTRMCQTSLT